MPDTAPTPARRSARVHRSIRIDAATEADLTRLAEMYADRTGATEAKDAPVIRAALAAGLTALFALPPAELVQAIGTAADNRRTVPAAETSDGGPLT